MIKKKPLSLDDTTVQSAPFPKFRITDSEGFISRCALNEETMDLIQMPCDSAPIG